MRLAILGRGSSRSSAPRRPRPTRARSSRPRKPRPPARPPSRCGRTTRASRTAKFRIPALHAAMLRKAIQSLTNPVRHDTTRGSGIDPDLPQAVREGIAFTQVVEAIDAHWLPSSGGVGATVVVTMTLEQLMDKLDVGRRVHPGHRRPHLCLRRLAGWPAAQGSSRSSSAGSQWCSMPAPSAASTPNPCASPWACATEAAPPRTATSPPRCATPTTTSPSAKAERPASRTAACCADTTTAASTTPLRPRQAAHRQGQVPPQDVSQHLVRRTRDDSA